MPPPSSPLSLLPRRPTSTESEYQVRVFDRRGWYPAGTIATPTGLFHADSELVFAVTQRSTWRELDEDSPYSEFDWVSPDEVRLLGSILLCEQADGGKICFYPKLHYSPLVGPVDRGADPGQLVEDVKLLLRGVANTQVDPPHFHAALRDCFAAEYDLRDPGNFDLGRQSMFWQRCDPTNYVLARGISTMIKSDMLACHLEFGEEALMTLYVALDASFALVTDRLKEEGNPDPSAHDAAKWVHTHFDSHFGHPEPTSLEKYFGEFYNDRIRTLHPANRFGRFPYSPTMADDLYDLRDWVRQVFSYLLSGAHDSGFAEEISKARPPL